MSVLVWPKRLNRGFSRMAVPRAKPSKYKNKATFVDGIRFASRLEAQCWIQQKAKVSAGAAKFVLRQTPFHLDGGVKYLLDFMVFNMNGTVSFIDAKGAKTAVYKIKKKMVEARFGITIQEWRG